MIRRWRLHIDTRHNLGTAETLRTPLGSPSLQSIRASAGLKMEQRELLVVVHSQFRQINYLRHKFSGKLPNDSVTAWMERERMAWVITGDTTSHFIVVFATKGSTNGCLRNLRDDQQLPPTNQQRPSVWGNLLIATKSQTLNKKQSLHLLLPTYQDLVAMFDSHIAWMTIVVFSCTVLSLTLSCFYLVWQARSSRANKIRLPFGPTFYLIYSQEQWSSSRNTRKERSLFWYYKQLLEQTRTFELQYKTNSFDSLIFSKQ